AGAAAAGGGGGGAQAAARPPPASTEPQAQGQGAGAANTPAGTPEKRKDPGSDLILRNLRAGQEATIPEVVEFAWDKPGSFLAYTISSTDAAKDGAFIRRTSDGIVS